MVEYLDRALLTILSYGQVFSHIAMIMYGNHRHARVRGLQVRGHERGFANAANMRHLVSLLEANLLIC